MDKQLKRDKNQQEQEQQDLNLLGSNEALARLISPQSGENVNNVSSAETLPAPFRFFENTPADVKPIIIGDGLPADATPAQATQQLVANDDLISLYTNLQKGAITYNDVAAVGREKMQKANEQIRQSTEIISLLNSNNINIDAQTRAAAAAKAEGLKQSAAQNIGDVRKLENVVVQFNKKDGKALQNVPGVASGQNVGEGQVEITPQQRNDAEITIKAAAALGDKVTGKNAERVFEAQRIVIMAQDQEAARKKKELDDERPEPLTPAKGLTSGFVKPQTDQDKKYDTEKLNSVNVIKQLAEKAKVDPAALLVELVQDIEGLEKSSGGLISVASSGPDILSSASQMASKILASNESFKYLAKTLNIPAKELQETLLAKDPKTSRTVLQSLRDTLTFEANRDIFAKAGLRDAFDAVRANENVTKILDIKDKPVVSRGVMFAESANTTATK